MLHFGAQRGPQGNRTFAFDIVKRSSAEDFPGFWRIPGFLQKSTKINMAVRFPRSDARCDFLGATLGSPTGPPKEIAAQGTFARLTIYSWTRWNFLWNSGARVTLKFNYDFLCQMRKVHFLSSIWAPFWDSPESHLDNLFPKSIFISRISCFSSGAKTFGTMSQLGSIAGAQLDSKMEPSWDISSLGCFNPSGETGKSWK